MKSEINSRIFLGSIFHQRNSPTVHSFTYPMFYLKLRLNEIKNLGLPFFFKHNSFGICSIYDNDYLSHVPGSLSEKVIKTLKFHNITEEPGYIDLVTHPRLFGYVFNPVSFFLCYRHNSELYAVIAEVHNTFGEKHLYILGDKELQSSENTKFKFYKCNKVFHVSPFFSREGDYRFIIDENKDKLDIRVNLTQTDENVFTSRLNGEERLNWSFKGFLKALIFYPGSIILTMPRIIYQAILLRWRKKLKVFTKPIASHPMTIESKGPGIAQKLSWKILEKFLSNAEYGSLEFRYPDNTSNTIEGRQVGPKAHINVSNYDIFLRSLISGDVGFGESYVEGDWDSENLFDVLTFFCINQPTMDDRSIAPSYLGRIKNFISHLRRKNTLSKSSHNIQKHYDLSNELFGTFLDKNMLYSSGIFNSPEDSLEQAQLNKMNALIAKADIKSGENILEIGSGWGALSIHIAKTTGCSVTGITLSREQKAFADKRIKEEGLEHLVKIELVDYRNLQGKFDKIISVEMIEAVGHQYLGTFFKCCSDLLTSNGKLVIQAITIPEQRYDVYKNGCDWIQKYIFPGGHCPSLEKLLSSAKKSSDFILDSTHNIGLHYAKTLNIWNKRFHAEWHQISDSGFDERFKRIWNYYLTYCEVGFSTGLVNTHQLVFERSTPKIKSFK